MWLLSSLGDDATIHMGVQMSPQFFGVDPRGECWIMWSICLCAGLRHVPNRNVQDSPLTCQLLFSGLLCLGIMSPLAQAGVQ